MQMTELQILGRLGLCDVNDQYRLGLISQASPHIEGEEKL